MSDVGIEEIMVNTDFETVIDDRVVFNKHIAMTCTSLSMSCERRSRVSVQVPGTPLVPQCHSRPLGVTTATDTSRFAEMSDATNKPASHTLGRGLEAVEANHFLNGENGYDHIQTLKSADRQCICCRRR